MSRRFFTVEDLNRAPAGDVFVDEDTIVTPQAMEAAKSAGVRIMTQAGAYVEPAPDRGPDAAKAASHLPNLPEPMGDVSGATAVIVTVVGKNRPGILAEVTQAIAQFGANVEDITQKMVENYFNLMFVVELPSGGDFDSFKQGMECMSNQDYAVRAMHEKVFRFMHRI